MASQLQFINYKSKLRQSGHYKVALAHQRSLYLLQDLLPGKYSILANYNAAVA